MVEQLLADNKQLCKRLKSLEDRIDARSTSIPYNASLVSGADDQDASTARPFDGKNTLTRETIMTRFTFDKYLQSSRVYRMAKRQTCDESFNSSTVRTHAWSVFSGLSLADISALSVVALPLYEDDIIGDHAKYYDFCTLESPLIAEADRDFEDILAFIGAVFDEKFRYPIRG